MNPSPTRLTLDETNFPLKLSQFGHFFLFFSGFSYNFRSIKIFKKIPIFIIPCSETFSSSVSSSCWIDSS